MSELFTSYKIGPIELRNRTIRSAAFEAMCPGQRPSKELFVGTAEEPRWYHFDCTHLNATYSHSGCLLTDQQLKAFNRFRAGFYAYDSSKYPATDKTIITRTPDLEKYY